MTPQNHVAPELVTRTRNRNTAENDIIKRPSYVEKKSMESKSVICFRFKIYNLIINIIFLKT